MPTRDVLRKLENELYDAVRWQNYKRNTFGIIEDKYMSFNEMGYFGKTSPKMKQHASIENERSLMESNNTIQKLSSPVESPVEPAKLNLISLSLNKDYSFFKSLDLVKFKASDYKVGLVEKWNPTNEPTSFYLVLDSTF